MTGRDPVPLASARSDLIPRAGGTFTEDALHEATPEGAEIEALRTATVHDAILAVERGEAERALVPVRELDRGVGAQHARHPGVRHREG